MNANAKLISTMQTPHGGYCLANFIKIDPPHGCYDAAVSFKTDALLMVISSLFPPNLSHSTLHGCSFITEFIKIDASWMLLRS